MRGVRFVVADDLDAGVGLTIGEARLRAVSASERVPAPRFCRVGPNEGEGSEGKLDCAGEGIAGLGRKEWAGLGDGPRAGEVSGEKKSVGVPWLAGKGEGWEDEAAILGVIAGESRERIRS